MWSRVLGLSNEKQEESSSGSKRHKDEQRSQRKRTESTVSSNPTRKPSRSNDTERGFNPTSTSYSTSSRSPYPGPASASVASSYATATSNTVEAVIQPPDLVRNSSLADQMPKSKSGQDEGNRVEDRERKAGRRRDRSTSRDRKVDKQERPRSRDREERRRDKKERREKRSEKDGDRDRGLDRSETEHQGASRAADQPLGNVNFNSQIGGAGFTQFPGQYEGAIPGPISGPPQRPTISDHVPDQFPGQFPTGAAAPYRPPLAVSQGGPGLAADYYGDSGESVAHQPGVRPQAPSLIIGAQPHLMAASPIEAPPIEPSATGGVGAAASFFSGATFQSPSSTPVSGQQPERPTGEPQQSSGPTGSFVIPAALAGSAVIGYVASTHAEGSYSQRPPNYVNDPNLPPIGTEQPPSIYRPPENYPPSLIPSVNSVHTASAPIIPTIGSATIGAAAGYMMGSHTSQSQQTSLPPRTEPLSSYIEQHPPPRFEAHQESFPGNVRPLQAGKPPSPSSNVPLYAAGAIGAAGLAAAAYHHEHQGTPQASYSGQTHSSTTIAHRHQHQHHGPLSKFVDFFRDPEGVAQFEEYTEYIGVCRYCFEPGSTPLDAPRKHYYRKRRSNERLGASMRVDKETRYGPSDVENKKKNNSSWLTAGLEGYGLAKVGTALFGADRENDDGPSAFSGRPHYSTSSKGGRRYHNSPDRKSSTSFGVVRRESTDIRLLHRSRTRSRDRKTGLDAATVGAVGAAIELASNSKSKQVHRQSQKSSPPRWITESNASKEPSTFLGGLFNAQPEPRHGSQKKKKKSKSFLNFGNSSTSSTDVVLVTGSDQSRKKKSSKSKIKDHNDANAALLGLGAAAAALAAAESRKGDKAKRKVDVVAVKEVKGKESRKHDRSKDRRKHTPTGLEEDLWESAPEDDGHESVDSTLAYGFTRRPSQDSLQSNSSGTNKWSWRWGGKPKKRRNSFEAEIHIPTVAGAAAGLAGAAAGAVLLSQNHKNTAIGSPGDLPPLQHVYPIATSDPSRYDVARHESIMSSIQPIKTSRPAAIPLQQPQPVAPVSSAIYNSQTSHGYGYNTYTGPIKSFQQPQPSYQDPRYRAESAYGYVTRDATPGGRSTKAHQALPESCKVPQDRRPHRRDTAPGPDTAPIDPRAPKWASSRDDVTSTRFDAIYGEEDRNRGDKHRSRKTSDPLTYEKENQCIEADGDVDELRRKSKRSSNITIKEKRRQEEEVNGELERLSREEARISKRKDEGSWFVPALAGVAGAVIGATAPRESSTTDRRQDQQKGEGKSKDDVPADDIEVAKSGQISSTGTSEKDKSEERKAAIAKQAAALVKRTPSPAHQDYAEFFAPAEILSHSKNKAPIDDSNGGNDITSHPLPEVRTIGPSDHGNSSAYTFTDIGEEDGYNPNFMRLPWQVPRLNLIKPTPPASTAGSVRGDASPIMRPEDVHPSVDEELAETLTRVKVTFGESQTREYEVITPMDQHDELVRSTDEHQGNQEESIEIQPKSNARSAGNESPIEKLPRDRMPGGFVDDIDFAATLAAGVQASGFDPAIVIDDPTYRRRDSPPGSEATGFYRRPLFETLDDLTLDSPGTEGAPPQRGYIEGELPQTPEDEVTRNVVENIGEENRTKENDKEEEWGRHKANSSQTLADDLIPLSIKSRRSTNRNDFAEYHREAHEPEIIEAAPRRKFVDLVEAATDQGSDSAEMKTNSTTKYDNFYDASESQREMNRDPDSVIVLEVATHIRLPIDVGDPILAAKLEHKSELEGSEGQAVDVARTDGASSIAATTPFIDDFGNSEKSRKKSKSKSSGFDDTASTVPPLAKFNILKEANGRAKKDSKGGLFGAFRNSSKQTPDEQAFNDKEVTSDDFDEHERKGMKPNDRKSKRGGDGFYKQDPEAITELPLQEEGVNANPIESKNHEGRRDSQISSKTDGDSSRAAQEPPAKDNMRLEDNDMMCQEPDDDDYDKRISRSTNIDKPLSFLGMRREETEPPDKAGLPEPGGQLSMEVDEKAFRELINSKIIGESLPPLPLSRPTTPTAVGSYTDLPPLPRSRPASPAATPGGKRRLSALHLADSSHPAASPSPTAVPLIFRRFPSSTGVPRSSPSTPGMSPHGSTTFSPRQRHSRPLSTEIRSTEFRPLWLVDMHDPSRRDSDRAPEEVYPLPPSVPPSHSTSRASSVHSAEEEIHREVFDQEETHHKALRAQHSDIIISQIDSKHDFLDSQQPTPTTETFRADVGIDRQIMQESNPISKLPRSDWENVEELPALPHSRDTSPYNDEDFRTSSSVGKDLLVGATVTAAAAMNLESTNHHYLDGEDIEASRAIKGESNVDGNHLEHAELIQTAQEAISSPVATHSPTLSETKSRVNDFSTVESKSFEGLVAVKPITALCDSRGTTSHESLVDTQEPLESAGFDLPGSFSSEKGLKDLKGQSRDPENKTSEVSRELSEDKSAVEAAIDKSSTPLLSRKSKKDKKGTNKVRGIEIPKPKDVPEELSDLKDLAAPIDDNPMAFSKKGKKNKKGKNKNFDREVPETSDVLRYSPDQTPLTGDGAVCLDTDKQDTSQEASTPSLDDDWTASVPSKNGRQDKKGKGKSRSLNISETIDIPGGFPDESAEASSTGATIDDNTSKTGEDVYFHTVEDEWTASVPPKNSKKEKKRRPKGRHDDMPDVMQVPQGLSEEVAMPVRQSEDVPSDIRQYKDHTASKPESRVLGEEQLGLTASDRSPSTGGVLGTLAMAITTVTGLVVGQGEQHVPVQESGMDDCQDSNSVEQKGNIKGSMFENDPVPEATKTPGVEEAYSKFYKVEDDALQAEMNDISTKKSENSKKNKKIQDLSDFELVGNHQTEEHSALTETSLPKGSVEPAEILDRSDVDSLRKDLEEPPTKKTLIINNIAPEEIPLPSDNDIELLPCEESIETSSHIETYDVYQQRKQSPVAGQFKNREILPEEVALPLDDDTDLLSSEESIEDFRHREADNIDNRQQQFPTTEQPDNKAIALENIALLLDDDPKLIHSRELDGTSRHTEVQNLQGHPHRSSITEEPINELVPEQVPLPQNDDLDLLPSVPDRPKFEFQALPESNLEGSPAFNHSEADEVILHSQLLHDEKEPMVPAILPEEIALPQTDDLELLQILPEEIPLPQTGDLELLPSLPASPELETEAVPEDILDYRLAEHQDSEMRTELPMDDGLEPGQAEDAQEHHSDPTTDYDTPENFVEESSSFPEKLTALSLASEVGKRTVNTQFEDSLETDNGFASPIMKKGRRSEPVISFANSLPEERGAVQKPVNSSKFVTTSAYVSESSNSITGKEIQEPQDDNKDLVFSVTKKGKKGKKMRKAEPVMSLVESLPEELESTEELRRALDEECATAQDAVPEISDTVNQTSLRESSEGDRDYTLSSKKGKKVKKNRKFEPTTSLVESFPEELDATQEVVETFDNDPVSSPHNTLHEPAERDLGKFLIDERAPTRKKGKKGKKQRLSYQDFDSSSTSEPRAGDAIETQDFEHAQPGTEVFAEKVPFRLGTRGEGEVESTSQDLKPASIPDIGDLIKNESESASTIATTTIGEEVRSMHANLNEGLVTESAMQFDKCNDDRSVRDIPASVTEEIPRNALQQVPVENDNIESLRHAEDDTSSCRDDLTLSTTKLNKGKRSSRNALPRPTSNYQDTLESIEPNPVTVAATEPSDVTPLSLASEDLLQDKASKIMLPEEDDKDRVDNQLATIESATDKTKNPVLLEVSHATTPTDTTHDFPEHDDIVPMNSLVSIQNPYHVTGMGVLDVASSIALPTSDDIDLEEQHANLSKSASESELQSIEVMTESISPRQNIRSLPLEEVLRVPLPEDSQDDFANVPQQEHEANAPSLVINERREHQVMSAVESEGEPSRAKLTFDQTPNDPYEQQQQQSKDDCVPGEAVQASLYTATQYDHREMQEHEGEIRYTDKIVRNDDMTLDKDYQELTGLVEAMDTAYDHPDMSAMEHEEAQRVPDEVVVDVRNVEPAGELQQSSEVDKVVSEKKNKKGKKKKSPLTMGWDEETLASTDEKPEAEPSRPLNMSKTQSDRLITVAESVTTLDAAISLMKNKKDKKKGKKGQAFDWNDGSTGSTTSSVSKATLEAEATKTEIPETPSANLESSRSVIEDSRPEDADVFTLKKSKKDKKKAKKGKSMAWDEKPEPLQEAELEYVSREHELNKEEPSAVSFDDKFTHEPSETFRVEGEALREDPTDLLALSYHLTQHREAFKGSRDVEDFLLQEVEPLPESNAAQELDSTQESNLVKEQEDDCFVSFGKKGKQSEQSSSLDFDSRGHPNLVPEAEGSVTLLETSRDDERGEPHFVESYENLAESVRSENGLRAAADPSSVTETQLIEPNKPPQEQERVNDDGFVGFATKKKGKKGKKGSRSEPVRSITGSTSPAPQQRTLIAEPQSQTVSEGLETIDDAGQPEESAELGTAFEERVVIAPGEDFPEFGNIKRKKSKRPKKQQPVIWEDDTATAGSPKTGINTHQEVVNPSSEEVPAMAQDAEISQFHSVQGGIETLIRPGLDVTDQHPSFNTANEFMERGECPAPLLEDSARYHGSSEEPRRSPKPDPESLHDRQDMTSETTAKEVQHVRRHETEIERESLRGGLSQAGGLEVKPSEEDTDINSRGFLSTRLSQRGRSKQRDSSATGHSLRSHSSSRSLGLLPGDVKHGSSSHPDFVEQSPTVAEESPSYKDIDNMELVPTTRGSFEHLADSEHHEKLPEHTLLPHSSSRSLGLLPGDVQHGSSSYPDFREQPHIMAEKVSLNNDVDSKVVVPKTRGSFEELVDSHHNGEPPENLPEGHRLEQHIISLPERLVSSTPHYDREVPTEAVVPYVVPSQQRIAADMAEDAYKKKAERAATKASAVAAGVALFEDLHRRTSVSKPDKMKVMNSTRSAHPEESKGGESSSEHATEPLATNNHQDSVTSEQQNPTFGPITTNLYQAPQDATANRDSAIHVSDSPLTRELAPVHQSVRDSGYQGTEVSPTFPEAEHNTARREIRMSDDSIVHGEPRRLTSIRDSNSTMFEDTNHSIMGMDESAENPLNISVEFDPAYNGSVSMPEHRHQHRRTSATAQYGGFDRDLPTYDQDHYQRDSPTSTERRPSPIDSTTKARSSELFQSSPSTRENLVRSHGHEEASPADYASRYGQDDKRSRAIDEFSSPTRLPTHAEPLQSNQNLTTHEHGSSLFGGPIGINSDLKSSISPPRTPTTSSRRQLNTIDEHGPLDALMYEHARAMSDVGLPEHDLKTVCRSTTPQGVSDLRIYSPQAESLESKAQLSTDDMISRLSWPAVDEDAHSVDLDRNKSRNTDRERRSSSRQSPLPLLASDAMKQHEIDLRSISGASIRSGESINAIIRSPIIQSPGTPPLRRVDRSISSDLRAANRRSGAKILGKQAEADLDVKPVVASSSSYDPVNDKGKGRITKMTDVYEGWGDVHDSPRSPTRPASMRKRQSMQLLDLQIKVDQLVSENRTLQDAKNRADANLNEIVRQQNEHTSALTKAVESRDVFLRQKDEELNELRRTLDNLHNEVSRLTEVNEGLQGSSRVISSEHEQRYSQLESEHAEVHERWKETTQELEDMRNQHASLSGGMESIVRHEVELALASKNAELLQMRSELDAAKDQVRRLQQEILASRSTEDTFVERDEDYFDSQCQDLCQRVQLWVLRFSKFSDSKVCHSINDVADEKITDRFDNAILDGSDVDIYLKDRTKRRDVFMSVVMTMVWEYVFTRYLFGMDREQRSKLKSLEKTLSEVGPPKAVNKWRATTLSMLAKREAFDAQRQQDTEAVVQEIYDTLATLLTPPAHLVESCVESLRKVISVAVDLSIEMRTQRAEYIMLPPLQPEYDTNGDLARQVYFNPTLMNERSGTTSSNEELGAQQAVVRMVLFPLVVKRGDDDGVGSEEIVVCPAQVLIAKDDERRGSKKSVRVMSAQSDRMEGISNANQSVQSFAPSSMEPGMGRRF